MERTRLHDVLRTGCMGNMPCCYVLVSSDWGRENSYGSVRLITNKSVDFLTRGNGYKLHATTNSLSDLLEQMAGAHPIGRQYAYRTVYEFESPDADEEWDGAATLIETLNLRKVNNGPDFRSWAPYAQTKYEDLSVYAART